MHKAMKRVSSAQVRSININKLQATACIVSSSAVSVGLIYWVIKAIVS